MWAVNWRVHSLVAMKVWWTGGIRERKEDGRGMRKQLPAMYVHNVRRFDACLLACSSRPIYLDFPDEQVTTQILMLTI